jgi:predicted nucleic acid-binding Zn finger protein
VVTTGSTTDPRSRKAVALAETAGQWLKCRTRDGRKAFGVTSQSVPGHYYLVDLRTCTCPDARLRGTPCKHVAAVRLYCAQVRAQHNQLATQAA